MTTVDVSRSKDLPRAGLWMMGAVVSLTVMAVAGRELSRTLSTFEILFFRSSIGLVILTPIILHRGLKTISTRQPSLQVLRNIVHFAGQYGWFYGIGFLPLGLVFALEFTTPIWVAVLAAIFLGEKLTPLRLAAIVLGFIGVLVILRPGFSAIDPIALVVLLGAAGYGAAHTTTKALTRTDTALAVLFYMTLIQLPLGLIPALNHWITPSLDLTPLLFLVGVMGLTAHYCMTHAFALADATVVMPFDFLRLPLALGVGGLFYGETVDPWLPMGGLVIIGAAFLILRDGRRHHQK
ncbi:MAG: DMT family transporter [Alphaproteobacteria bacterium]